MTIRLQERKENCLDVSRGKWILFLFVAVSW